MNIYVAFGIFGIISSLLASLADVPLVKPGKPKPGGYIGLLCQVVYCMKPLLYQKLSKKMSDSESLEVIKAIDPMIKVPMVIGFLSLWPGGTIIMIIAVVTGTLAVPKACVLLNPIVALLVLMVVKKCGNKCIKTITERISPYENRKNSTRSPLS